MRVYSKKTAGAVALFASAALVLSGCSGAADTAEEPEDTSTPAAETVDTLKIAALLPQTGSLGFLMPPVQAGIDRALIDINEAGGVLGNDVELVGVFNEHDGTDTTVIDKSVDQLLSSDAAYVLGAMSSSRTLHVIDKITGAGMMMGSPSNTAVALDGYSPFYFRTAPPDSVQGTALAQQIVDDGVTDLAFLTFNDDYGLGLRDKIQEVTEGEGVNITYGATGEGNEFAVDQQTFTSDVTAAIKSGAEAIAVVTFDQINQILPELLAQGWDPSKVYLVDGNANSFEDVVDPGTVVGMQGSIPGAQAKTEFEASLREIYEENQGQKLESLTYGPEAYDLVVLTALASIKGGSADSETIRDNVHAVSGADGGTECTSFKECADLIENGDDIQYRGQSGIGALEDGSPSSAFIGIYKYDEENSPVFQQSVEG